MRTGSRLISGVLVCIAMAAVRPAAAQAEEPSTPAGSSQVKQPELLTFVPAPYPDEAKRQGLEGDVDLVLEIDREGHVEKAEVLTPAGHGFDEAAQAAALKFVFRPATLDGRPVKSRIVYRYSFHFTPEKPVESAKVTSVLGGHLLIAGTKTPLAGARVEITRDGEPIATVVSGADGGFVAPGLAAGRYAVKVSAAGYQPFTSSEELAPSEEVSVRYDVMPIAVGEEEEVVVEGGHPHREVTRRSLSRRELDRVPGTSGDALRAIQNLPGVARPPALSGELVVRGTGDQSTPVFIDGLWVPNIYHFGGLSSVVPTEMLDTIDFYPGNFGVKYGRALGGVIDAHLRETRGDGRYHGLAQIDLIDARVMAEGPVPLASGWNFIGGFRRSHVDAWLIPLVDDEDTDIQGAPRYYDYQLIFDHRPTKKSYLRLGLLGYDDRIKLVNDSAPTSGALASSNASLGIGAIYKLKLSDTSQLELTTTLARSRQRFSLSTILADTEAFALLARGELVTKILPNATLRTGYDVLVAPYTFKGQFPESSSNGQDLGPFITLPSRAFDHEALFFMPAVYGELSVTPSRRSLLVSGVRLDYTHEGRRVDVSPRMTARYDLVHEAPRTTLKGGSGLFFQAPGLAEVVLSDSQTHLRSTRSWQNSLGVEQQLGDHVEASLEGFYNLLDDVIGRAPDETGTLRYNNLATGRIYGMELMLRYRTDERFFGWISYTLSRSERTWNPGEPSELFYLDQPQILTMLGSYTLGAGWELGARFRYVTGNLYTPCIGGVYNSAATQYVCVQGPVNSERLPPFHQLDVRVDKRWVFSSFTLGVYLDVINVYNRTNPDFMSYNYDFSQKRPATGSLPIVPSLGIRGEL